MKYAVIFHSETGNTEKIAKEIYESLDTYEKEYIDLNENSFIPDADIYIIGFPVRNKTCSIKAIECMENLTTGKVILFATCGMRPTGKYKEYIEDSVTVWLPDTVEYLGMFLCQGKTVREQKEYLTSLNPKYSKKIEEMLREGDTHPDDMDIDDAIMFVKHIEHNLE